VTNAKALGEELAARGFRLITGGTDNHLLLVDMTPKNIAGKPYAQALDRAGIVANYNSIPFDPRKPFDPSGIRLGTAAIASRGMGPSEMTSAWPPGWTRSRSTRTISRASTGSPKKWPRCARASRRPESLCERLKREEAPPR
jgi:hypothetical protein